MAAALWACNSDTETGISPQVQQLTDLQPALSADSARLQAMRAAIEKDTVHDSLTKTAWLGTVDSLSAEWKDIAHDFANVGPRPVGVPNREKERLEALARGLGALEGRISYTPPNFMPKGLLPGPTINLNGKPVGNIAIKVFGGTSTTTQWPPSGPSGESPESLMITCDKEISLRMQTHSVKDWRISLYLASANPILDSTPKANWTRPGRDSIALGPSDFDSLSSLASSDGILRFNLRISMKGGFVESRMVFLTNLAYDKSSREFSKMDTVVQEDVINFRAKVKVSYLRDSIGNPLRTYLYIPGSPYSTEVDTVSFKEFYIPYGAYDFRMLAVPAEPLIGQEFLGLVYSVVTDERPRATEKLFYPVALFDSLLIKVTN
ncbi:MAG: hypothetical protein ABIW76_09805 [Fibrobacteria bacterium]